MIPLRLSLKNFLSYREATLDFRGLHTACICGANGAGKSSLLEAISWAIWGESRATSEDDVIHLGAQEVQVDFIFAHNHHTYRILRSRHRGQATSLEFQIAQETAHNNLPTSESETQPQTPVSINFRSLTTKGVRATQQLVLEHLRLDYETFVNSAYLRQGRADEFMLKRPSERKQILADLLKLNQYDELAERAKDQARQAKGQIELLEHQLETIQHQLYQQDAIAQEHDNLEATLAQTQQQQTLDAEQLQTLQATQHQRQTWQQQLSWQQQQQRILEQDCHRLQQELATTQHQQQELETLLQQADTIIAGYAHFQALQTQEAQFSARFKAHQLAQAQRQQYAQQQQEQVTQLQTQLQHLQAQLDLLQQQEQEIQHTLRKATTVEAALKSLQQARSHLNQLDQLQLKAMPLLQRRQHLQTQLERSQARLSARLEELSASARQLQLQQECQSHLQVAVLEISDRIETLEQRRAYQHQVREKGLERRSFMERLQADQRNYEAQLADVEQKIQLLQQGKLASKALEYKDSPPSSTNHTTNSKATQTSNIKPQTSNIPYPPCPLCDRPLDEHHWNVVLQKHYEKQQDILNHIWVIREQLSTSEREIQILRQEYREIDRDLHQYPTILERRGQLQEQLQATLTAQQTLAQLFAEMDSIQRSLQTGAYATDLHNELTLLDQSLQALNYDEKDHALARGEVERWRWAEVKQAEIKQAQRRQKQMMQRQPELQQQLTELQTQLERLNQETSNQLKNFDQHIAQIGYNLEQHNALQVKVQQEQIWQLRYQELIRAQQQHPKLQQQVRELHQSLKERQDCLQINQGQIQTLLQRLQQVPDCQKQILELEQRLLHRRTELDEQLAAYGRLQQQQHQLEALRSQVLDFSTQLQTTRRQYRVYQELSQAFGKNGIQALMIENVLPQLEAETNRILARLSANQLHIQFVTQRSHRRNLSRPVKGKLESTRLIETLDILIADARGTRPYETYSGGEAFRVNFAIRLALARLLAQRSGTALQMLIIDEGFGTQDAEGCDRLIAAINAITPDFACILTVTHVPHFKEAFQSRIEVFKTEDGSQLQLIG
ncbi:ATPase involved in DNA repair [Leptolyngbyaceae cyanobacterium JSC-12]|nr:ATPase involved in DNA repair [Leptolyngbyaceae cyanobacterium JSC-12]